jgi:hypothetical protein
MKKADKRVIMSQEIIVQGSAEEIARKIAEFPGKIVKAILVVEAGSTEDDAWTRDFRRWAASHKPAPTSVDYARETIYGDRLG